MRILKERMQWNIRMILLMFGIVGIVLLLSFMSIYQIFVDTVQGTMLETTENAFVQAEINIDRKLKSTVKTVNGMLYHDRIYDFEENNYANEISRTVGTMEIIKEFDRIISINHDMFGLGILCSDGRVVASTKKNRTLGSEVMSKEGIRDILAKSDAAYPEYIWTGNFKNYLNKGDSLAILEQEHVIIGIRALGNYRDVGEENAYIIVAMRESVIEECYSQIFYSENEVMLLANREIISSTNKSKLGQELPYDLVDEKPQKVRQFVWKYQEEKEKYQIIQYNTVLQDWILVNQVPKKIYENATTRLKILAFFIGIATMSVMCIFFTLWMLKYATPIQRLMNGMKRVEEGDYSLMDMKSTGVKELDDLNVQFNSMTQKLKDSIVLLKKNEVALRTEELRTLQFQINPHFLLNSINSIRWMAMMSNSSNVADALVILNKIIYPILKAPSFWGSVKEEIDFADNYIQMLKIRFSSLLTYRIECEEELYHRIFPRFILQPIIENCFTHGMNKGEPLFVETSIKEENGSFYIRVHNTGKPVEKWLLNQLNHELNHALNRMQEEGGTEDKTGMQDSVGLKNIRKRLELLYGNKSKMWLESEEEVGTVVYLEFPILIEEKNPDSKELE